MEKLQILGARNTTQSWILSSLGLGHSHPPLQSLINLIPSLLSGAELASQAQKPSSILSTKKTK